MSPAGAAHGEHPRQLRHAQARNRVRPVHNHSQRRHPDSGREGSVRNPKAHWLRGNLQIVPKPNARVLSPERREGRAVKRQRRHRGIVIALQHREPHARMRRNENLIQRANHPRQPGAGDNLNGSIGQHVPRMLPRNDRLDFASAASGDWPCTANPVAATSARQSALRRRIAPPIATHRAESPSRRSASAQTGVDVQRLRSVPVSWPAVLEAVTATWWHSCCSLRLRAGGIGEVGMVRRVEGLDLELGAHALRDWLVPHQAGGPEE